MAYNLNRKINKFIPEWNNNQASKDPIEIEINPLDIDDYCELLDISVKSRENVEKTGKKNKKGENISVIKDFTVSGKVALRLIPIFRKNITAISNLTINNQTIKPEEIVRNPEFIELVSEIMNSMIVNSIISEDDKKN